LSFSTQRSVRQAKKTRRRRLPGGRVGYRLKHVARGRRGVDWARLLRRSLSLDVLECRKCHGRLRVVAVMTEREPVRHILTHLGMPTVPPTVARARDPTDDMGDHEPPEQLALDLA
jgi:hypothetical protein